MTKTQQSRLTQKIVETLAESALTKPEAEMIMQTALEQYATEWAKEE